MKKIVITGGLGYIGTELCKIYSGYSWNDEIVVIDNRFISERVSQLRDWNIHFVHGDILDKELIKKHCSYADIVHHLAGITDVPRVQSESNVDHDVKIKAKVIDQIRDNKIIVFKKKRRHNYRRKIGHRQDLTLVKIEEIITSSSSNKKPKENQPKKEVSDGS